VASQPVTGLSWPAGWFHQVSAAESVVMQMSAQSAEANAWIFHWCDTGVAERCKTMVRVGMLLGETIDATATPTPTVGGGQQVAETFAMNIF
jgi:hypothetical protein